MGPFFYRVDTSNFRKIDWLIVFVASAAMTAYGIAYAVLQ